MQIIGKQQIKIVFIIKKKISESITPLLTNRRCGRKNDTRRSQPADQFKAENGFSASGCGNNMNLAVFQIFIRIVKNTLLITAESTMKMYAVKSNHLISP